MAIHRRYGPRDEEDQAIGDSGFMGVNDRADPRQLPEGLCAAAVNKSFESGVAETRCGWMTPSWGGAPALQFDPNFDGIEEGINFDPDGDGVEEGATFEPLGFGEVFGRLVFSDPNGREATLLAVWNGVWRIRSLSEPELIRLPENETITGPVRFVQAFDKVLMLRGKLSTLEWDPQESFEDGIGAFEEIAQTTAGAGSFLTNAPPSDDAICFANRVWYKLNGSRDQLGVSDILDYTHCDIVLNKLRINAGTDDEIVRCLPYAGRTILVLKRRSGYILDGVWADNLSDMVTCDRLSGCPGCVGRDAAAEVGKEVVFLSDGHVWSVGQTEEGKLQAGSEPLSAPIAGLMRRIHWTYAHLAQMQVHGDRLHLAVPLDGATFNNAILVYNLTTKHWEGTWTADWLRLVAFAVLTENDGQRLAFINGVGGRLKLHWWAEVGESDRTELASAQVQSEAVGLTDGALCVMGAGKQDVVYGHTSWIKDEIVTRGYNLGPLQQVRSVRLTLDNATWNPRFSVFVRGTNARGEEVVAADVRRGFERSGVVIDLLQITGVITPSIVGLAYDTAQAFTPGSPYWTSTGETGHSTAIDYFYDGVGLDLLRGTSQAGYFGIWIPFAPQAGETYTCVVDDLQMGHTATFNVTYGDATVVHWMPSPRGAQLSATQPLRVTVTAPGKTIRVTNMSTPFRLYWAPPKVGAVYHSRKQLIFRKPEVLWREGAAPVELNDDGHDDFAWRLGAGLGQGVVLGATHRLSETYLVRRKGEFLQVRVAGERGFSGLHGVRVDAQIGQRGIGHRT